MERKRTTNDNNEIGIVYIFSVVVVRVVAVVVFHPSLFCNLKKKNSFLTCARRPHATRIRRGDRAHSSCTLRVLQTTIRLGQLQIQRWFEVCVVYPHPVPLSHSLFVAEHTCEHAHIHPILKRMKNVQIRRKHSLDYMELHGCILCAVPTYNCTR